MRTADKALVTYASWSGTTAEVAECLRESLQADGLDVDLAATRSVADIDQYALVVAGTAIRMGRTHSDYRSFIARHRDVLAKTKFAAFIVCGTLKEKNEKTCSEAGTFLASALEAAPELAPIATATFGGAIAKRRLSWPYRLMFRLMGEKGGDWRDWNAIKSWGHEVAEKSGTR